MKQYYSDDQMQVLEAVARSSQPILIKGAVGSGKTTLSEILQQLNPDRKFIFDGIDSLGSNIKSQLEYIETLNEYELILSGSVLPKWLSDSMGNHIQIKIIKLENCVRTLRVDYVFIPEKQMNQVTLNENSKITAVINEDKKFDESLKIVLHEKGKQVNEVLHIDIKTYHMLVEVNSYLNKHLSIIKLAKEALNIEYKEVPIILNLNFEEIKLYCDNNHDESNFMIRISTLLKYAKAKNIHLIIQCENGQCLDSLSIESFNILDFRSFKSNDRKDISNPIDFKTALNLIKLHLNDVIIVNNTNEMCTQLFDYFGKYPQEGLGRINMDNWYNNSTTLGELIQANKRVMITTKNKNTAYAEMLVNPLILTVSSFNDKDIITMEGICMVGECRDENEIKTIINSSSTSNRTL